MVRQVKEAAAAALATVLPKAEADAEVCLTIYTYCRYRQRYAKICCCANNGPAVCGAYSHCYTTDIGGC